MVLFRNCRLQIMNENSASKRRSPPQGSDENAPPAPKRFKKCSQLSVHTRIAILKRILAFDAISLACSDEQNPPLRFGHHKDLRVGGVSMGPLLLRKAELLREVQGLARMNASNAAQLNLDAMAALEQEVDSLSTHDIKSVIDYATRNFIHSIKLQGDHDPRKATPQQLMAALKASSERRLKQSPSQFKPLTNFDNAHLLTLLAFVVWFLEKKLHLVLFHCDSQRREDSWRPNTISDWYDYIGNADLSPIGPVLVELSSYDCTVPKLRWVESSVQELPDIWQKALHLQHSHASTLAEPFRLPMFSGICAKDIIEYQRSIEPHLSRERAIRSTNAQYQQIVKAKEGFHESLINMQEYYHGIANTAKSMIRASESFEKEKQELLDHFRAVSRECTEHIQFMKQAQSSYEEIRRLLGMTCSLLFASAARTPGLVEGPTTPELHRQIIRACVARSTVDAAQKEADTIISIAKFFPAKTAR